MFNRKYLRSKFSEIAGWDTDVTKVIVDTGDNAYLKTRSIEAIKKGELELAIFLLGVAITKQNTECPIDIPELKRQEMLEITRLQSEFNALSADSSNERVDELATGLEKAKKIQKCKHKFQKATDGKWVCLKCGAAYGGR